MAFTLKKRRKVPRAPLNRPVLVKSGEREFTGRGIEVGVGGMSLWLDNLPRTPMLTVHFSLPGSSRRITAMAERVWTRPAAGEGRAAQLGVRFVALPRDEREEIRTYVTKLARCYRDLHILLAMNEWKLDRVQTLTQAAHIAAYRDMKELKERVQKAMDGFRL
jgi:hypothetical protein